MSYPFTMQLPDWLPPSMYLAAPYQGTRLNIQYHLRAQVTPVHEKDWADDERFISTLAGGLDVYVSRPEH